MLIIFGPETHAERIAKIGSETGQDRPELDSILENPGETREIHRDSHGFANADTKPPVPLRAEKIINREVA